MWTEKPLINLFLNILVSKSIKISSQTSELKHPCQGLMQKSKLHSDCEKVAQISILVNKVVTSWCSKIMIEESKQTIHLFSIFSLCLNYVADLIKKLDLCLTLVSGLLKIRFGHTQISVPKIGMPMSKTICINPCM